MYKESFHVNSSHYLGISVTGYHFEENGAFLPLLPWILRLFRCCLKPKFHVDSSLVLQLQLLLSMWHLLLCRIRFQVSNRLLSFLLSVLLFYKLSLLLLPERQAYDATLFYIFSPATAHFNAVYTETLSASLSFLCLYQYIRYMTSKEISSTSL